jgi:hypothetical protein
MSMLKSAAFPEIFCFPKFINAYARILHQILPRLVPVTSFAFTQKSFGGM